MDAVKLTTQLQEKRMKEITEVRKEPITSFKADDSYIELGRDVREI